MAKQSRKKLRRPKRRGFRKRTSKAGRAYGKMVGGDFTQEESQQLLGMGFTQQDIEVLSNTGVGLNIIQMSLTQVNPATGAPFTPQELIQSVNEANEEINQLDISGISNASEDDHNLDDGQNLNHDQNLNDSYNDSMNTTSEETNLNDSNVFNGNNNSQDSLHLSDLNVSADNGSANTTMEDDSFGGRKRKTRKGRKGRKGRKYGRKSRRQRGGMCFGNGVGANNYDPNFSIYNTRELTLFPYRPTN
jgi:hypothetical protein